MAEILSGSAVMLLGYFFIIQNGQVPQALHENAVAAISLFALIAWLLGTFFDMLRNLSEELWDHYSEIEWSFFFRGCPDKLANLEHYFYSFYMLDADMAIGLFLFVLFGPCFIINVLGLTPHVPIVVRVLLLVIAVVACSPMPVRS